MLVRLAQCIREAFLPMLDTLKVCSESADIYNAFQGKLVSTSGVLCTMELVDVPAAPVVGAVQAASLPLITPVVTMQCQGGSALPDITGGPDIVPYSNAFTGTELLHLFADP